MKLQLFSFLLLAASIDAASNDTPDCTECFEDLDDARDCLRECSDLPPTDGSGDFSTLLDQCIDQITDSSSNSKSIDLDDDIEDLVACCNMDNDCEDTLEDTALCLGGCFNPCFKQTAQDWLDCLDDETDKGSCDRGDCFEQLLEDSVEDEVGVDSVIDQVGSGSGDIFSIEAITDSFTDMRISGSLDFPPSCANVFDFVDTACDISNSCCDECSEEMGLMVDCLINDVVGSFIRGDLNASFPENCPVDISSNDCGPDFSEDGTLNSPSRKLTKKQLTEEQLEKVSKMLIAKGEKVKGKNAAFARAMAKRNLQDETVETPATSEDKVQKCQDKSVTNMIVSNATNAMNELFSCVVKDGLDSLTDAPESGAFAAGSVLSMFLALFALLI